MSILARPAQEITWQTWHETYQRPGATAVRFMMKSNLPARKIMETHTAVNELQVIYHDVLKTGEEPGVPMPHCLSLISYVDNPPVLHNH